MTKRIFRSICVVAVTMLLLTSGMLFYLLYSDFTEAQFKQLEMQTDMAKQGILLSGKDYFEGLDTQAYRATWIDQNGRVLYDSHSDSARMENHLEREEIRKAFETGNGKSARYSSTSMERSLYYALRLDDGTVIRISVSQSTVWMLLLDIAPSAAVILLVAILLSVVLAIRLSKSIVGPLNRLNLDSPLESKVYDEISPLLQRMDSQQKALKLQTEQLQKKKDELDTVIDCMNEGILLLNGQNRIISINPAAKKLLGMDDRVLGQEFPAVCNNTELQEILATATHRRRGEKILELEGESYLVDASPIISSEKVSGYAMLFFDITEQRSSEKLRREFTANVSHELKTPLHSIAGYAELMVNGMVRTEDTADFAEKIHTEAKRMTRLIEDIISLSHLDEGATDMQMTDLDLLALANVLTVELAGTAEAAEVKLEVRGQPVTVHGIPHLLRAILFNLCDNGIKYNRAGGSVLVEILREEDDAVLRVSDTGIGIPQEHQARVFERFYRVDKSHSKELGGTGLGLSIVKHAAKVHSAKVEMESIPGKGTTVTVRIPAAAE